MSKVLIVASGKSATDVKYYEDKVDWIIVVNNAWMATTKWKYWVRTGDYKGKRPNHLTDLQSHQTIIVPKIYETSLEKYGGYRACGFSITLNASYWALDNLKPTAIYYLGADMNYTPDEQGNTHFYGVGYDIQFFGESDPDKMAKRQAKRDSNYLTNIYLRFKEVAKENNCEVYNLSKVENSRLPYPRVTGILTQELNSTTKQNYKLTETSTNSLPNILFLHLSKTAGVSLRRALISNYQEENILQVYIKSDPNKDFNETMKRYIEHRYSLEKIKSTKLFIGHCAYGIHKMFEQKFDYITMVREPVDRIISHYYYSLKTDPNVKVQYSCLEDYIENRTNIHNWMTKRISNTELTDGDLDLAKENLMHNIAFCGITEMYQETLIMLRKMYGLSLDNIVANKNKDRQLTESIDPKIINRIKEIHYKDLELYEFAKALFIEKFKKINL